MNTKTVLACTAVVIALALIVAPLAISQDALAKSSQKQTIKLSQNNKQSSQSVGGVGNLLSGNNVNLQGQFNTGGNTAGSSD